MKSRVFLVALSTLMVTAPAQAQTRLNSVNGPGPTFIQPYNNPAFTNGGTFYPGTHANINGYNPYGPNPYGYGYGYGSGTYSTGLIPSYGMPVVMSNGLYRFGVGSGVNVNMWRANSGYYYPWAGLPSGINYNSTAILYSAQSTGTPQPQQPPITTIIRDMLSYLDESKSKGRLSDADYQHLKRRAADLQSKEDLLMNSGGGSMDPQDEQQLRADINSLGGEITERSHK